MARNGVLIVAVGGPASLDAAEPYLSSIHGHAPDEASVATLRRALLTIGGGSPASGRAERVAAALERVLNGIAAAEPLEEMSETLLPNGGMPSGHVPSIRVTAIDSPGHGSIGSTGASVPNATTAPLSMSERIG